MEEKGHEPDVYNTDEEGFDIGTCSKESPESTRNCVYNKEAADWLKQNRPREIFTESAVEMAEKMGIDLMDKTNYENFLQKKGEFDTKTRSWLKNPPKMNLPFDAIYGKRRNGKVKVDNASISSHDNEWGFRGSRRVSWKY